MSSQKGRLIVGILTLISLGLILAGLAKEQYWFSIAGFAVLLILLIQRGWHIRKLNKQIKTMKELKRENHHSPDS
jgi:NhaP-type Na+/H+ and K+/H+ antiporter